MTRIQKLIDAINYFSPMIIIGLTLWALARTITRTEFETAIRTLQAKSAQQDATLEAIREKMNEESWQKVEKSLRKSK